MAYDELFGLPKSAHHVIPRILDSEDDEQFSLGSDISHSASFSSMETSTSNSVVQMIEKRRNQSHCTLIGIWKSEQNDDDVISEDEEIQNDFSRCVEEFDLGFDSEIMRSHSTIWKTEDMDSKGFKSTLSKEGEPLPHTLSNVECQNNFHVPYSKPGNNSDTQVTDDTLHITEVYTHYPVGYENHDFGFSVQNSMESKKSSACVCSKVDAVVPNIDGTVVESNNLLDSQNKTNQTGKEMDLNDRRELNSETLQIVNGTSVNNSEATEIDGTSFDRQIYGTMKGEPPEEIVDDLTSKTPPNEAHQKSSVNGTPSSTNVKSPDRRAEDSQNTVNIPDGRAEDRQSTVKIPDRRAEDSQNTVNIPDGRAEDSQNTVNIPDGRAEDRQSTVKSPDRRAEDSHNTVNIPDGRAEDRQSTVKSPDRRAEDSHNTVNSPDRRTEDRKRQQPMQSTNISSIDRNKGTQDNDEGWDFPENTTTNRAHYGKNYGKPLSKKTGYQGWNYLYNYDGYGVHSFSPYYFKDEMRALEDFAADNGLELFDVAADGNCMFRSLEDQMRINAQFGQTAKSLRRRAVQYLRHNPIHEDGSHLKEFLSGKETWERYLVRMERNSSWGDHLILKALCDAVGITIVVFNISNDDIRRTELVPKVNDKSDDTQFFLGHLGEYHYVSLRPKMWERTWPLKAHSYREKWIYHLILSTYIEARLDNVELKKKIAKYEKAITQSRKMMSILSLQDELNDTETIPFRALPAVCLPYRYNDVEGSGEEAEEKQLHDQLLRVQKLVDEIPNCFNYRGWFEKESEDSRHLLTADPLYIDPECGVPSPHISFILRFCIQKYIQLPVIMFSPTTSKQLNDDFVTEYAGSSCDESNAYLVDQKGNGYSNTERKSDIPMKIFCRKDIVVKFERNENKEENEVFVDESQTHPGYCRLRPSVASEVLWGSKIFYVENDCFIKENDSSDSNTWPEYQGFQSHEWVPSKTDWKTRLRPSQWPSEELMEKFYKAGVLFVRRPHASSQLKIVEWEMIFSKAEKEIFLNILSANQKNSYNIFKVIVDYQTKHCRANLAPEHLKAVFLRAMELVPPIDWENNIGGCFLYLLNLLSDFLEKGNIPHYFISENNMIDHVPSESIRDLKLHVDAIKHFPIEVLEFCIERYGILEPEVSRITADIAGYKVSRNIFSTVEKVFIPILETKAEYYGDCYQFHKAHDAVLDAYMVYQQMIQITNTTANVLTLEEFVFKSLVNWSCVNRYKMLRMFDDLHNTNLCDKDKTSETVLVKSLLDEEIESEFADMPIPQCTLGNKGYEAKLLEDIATTCNFVKKNEESLVFIKAAISLLKKALQEDIFDVSEVEDAKLKMEIGRKNLQLTTSWNSQLSCCYEKLSTCCMSSHQKDLMFQYMPEIEALAQRLPKMVSFVEKMWIQLGQTVKGKEFRKKHEGFQRNDWGQNEYNDDID